MEIGRYDVLRHLGEYALNLSTRRNLSNKRQLVNIAHQVVSQLISNLSCGKRVYMSGRSVEVVY